MVFFFIREERHSIFFFFFQAEDGIRAPLVTGVQTCALPISTWIGQLITQWFNWANEQHDHNQPLQVGSFLWQFWESTLENWQSEFLQLFSFVVLSAYFIHKG